MKVYIGCIAMQNKFHKRCLHVTHANNLFFIVLKFYASFMLTTKRNTQYFLRQTTRENVRFSVGENTLPIPQQPVTAMGSTRS